MAKRRNRLNYIGCLRSRLSGSPPGSSRISIGRPSRRTRTRGRTAQSESTSSRREYSCSRRAIIPGAGRSETGANTSTDVPSSAGVERDRMKSPPSQSVPGTSWLEDWTIARATPAARRNTHFACDRPPSVRTHSSSTRPHHISLPVHVSHTFLVSSPNPSRRRRSRLGWRWFAKMEEGRIEKTIGEKFACASLPINGRGRRTTTRRIER
jgi:hypothetical protein